MGTREGYEPGIPSWVDVMSPDVDGSRAFYTGLFGWDAEDQHGEDGELVYVMFRHDGHDVAGLGGQMTGMEGMPAIWNTYVATADADETTRRAEAAGGNVVLAPMDVMDSGRMAVLQDPAGAAISVWQAGTHVGAQLVNGHAAFSWSELLTRERESVRSFYEEAFGWQLVDQDMGPMGTYTVATFDGERSFAGLMDMPDEVPSAVPSYWSPYFGHDDVDAACVRVRELGGQVVQEPFDVPDVGRMAAVVDPQGAAFNLMTSDGWQD